MALTRPPSALLTASDLKSSNGAGAYVDRVKVGSGAANANTQVTNGELELLPAGNGLLLKAPNGTRYRISADNAGAVAIAAAP